MTRATDNFFTPSEAGIGRCAEERRRCGKAAGKPDYGVLETTAQIFVSPPFYENFGKRLINSPKVYLADPGLACHLLGIETTAE
jgi:Domain of unknown function (DUF4143)